MDLCAVDNYPEHSGESAGCEGANGVFSRRHPSFIADQAAAESEWKTAEATKWTEDATTDIRHDRRFVAKARGWGAVEAFRGCG
jgi:hypothetical protein